jgi:arginyl-tRNA synthetase
MSTSSEPGKSGEYFGIEAELDSLFSQAAAQAFGVDSGFESTVRPSKHADFQINGVLALAKRLGKSPRDAAAELVAAIDTEAASALISGMDIAGPGFVNVSIAPQRLSGLVAEMSADPKLGLRAAAEPHTYVVDYAAPNIAKSMHVGHLRTSIIGDTIVRQLMALGHAVIRQDHQGDWGTQFGMLIEHLVDSGNPEEAAAAAVGDLDALYKQARTKFEADSDFARRARERVVALQGGDEGTLSLWRILVTTSRKHFHEVYGRLGLLLTDDDVRGESFYNDMLDDVVNELEQKGLAKIDDGALCVYPEGFTGRDGEPFPFIIRKSDGGYNYATTDLATLRDSVERLGADRLVYVTDVRQSQHFNMVFTIGRQAGWLPQHVTATHVGYGTVLGKDNKPFKARSGESVKLVGLLDEAVERANQALTERTGDLSDDERLAIARSVGIGAVKWADLKNEHTTNYVFDFDRMLAFSGNTGPYVQYASTRAKSVLRRAGAESPDASSVSIIEDAERDVALRLGKFEAAVQKAAGAYEPHHLCTYLFELADSFTTFYEKCPVLSADEPVRTSRLAICALVARTLDTGLDLLGIEPVDRM